MIIIRPINKNDAEKFIEFAFHAGMGMSSMPKNREKLLNTVIHASHSFEKEVEQPGDEHYLFVLEDLNSGKVEGTCGITAKTALSHPLYFYRLETIERMNTLSNLSQKIPILRLVHYYDMPSEIGSLYLSPECRHEGFGRLLSLSRFLFMASFFKRFDKMVFAVMRGYFEENGICPFWEGIGRHFCDVDFAEIEHLQEHDKLDISTLLPHYPIISTLLPIEVQNSIGMIQRDSVPALNMLVQEGFYLTDEIDVLDGGPKIEAEVENLRTVKSSIADFVDEITNEPVKGEQYILCNSRLDFRACYAEIRLKGKSGVCISKEVAEALQLKVGDPVRYVTKQGV